MKTQKLRLLNEGEHHTAVHKLSKRLQSLSKGCGREKLKKNLRSLSSHISDRIDEKLRYLNRPNWCNKKAQMLADYVLLKGITGGKEAKSSSRFWDHYYELLRKGIKHKKEQFLSKFTKKEKGIGPWKTLWKCKEHKLSENSPYSHFASLRIRPMIIKAGDDLRQEMLALNLIRTIKSIFDRERVNIYLRPYEVIIRDHTSGFIGSRSVTREFIPDSISIDSLKKKYPGKYLNDIFFEIFKDNLEMSQLNFLQSLVGYSLVCYLLKVKDRHNGNILMDAEGHLVHIDFGFILSNSPGGMDFETAPFKLTEVHTA